MDIVLYVLPVYIVVCVVGCIVADKNNKKQKVKIMSCRNVMKKFKKLDEAEKKSLF